METSVNGVRAEWSAATARLWDEVSASRPSDILAVISANRFFPRPYVDEYNRGSASHGFTYTATSSRNDGRKSVYQVILSPNSVPDLP